LVGTSDLGKPCPPVKPGTRRRHRHLSTRDNSARHTDTNIKLAGAVPIMWDLLARLAEYELKAITKRIKETREWLQANNFLVGSYPYGYITTPRDRRVGVM